MESEFNLKCSIANIAGTFLIPKTSHKIACIVIVGGTLSHTRDGAMMKKGVPHRDALRRIAEALAIAGYASIRYDKAGYGASESTDKWTGTYADEALIVSEAIHFAYSRSEINRVIVAGESAGAYLACISAKNGVIADGYIFLGGLCGSSEELYEYNFGSLAKYVDKDPKNLEWVLENNLQYDLALGHCYKSMLESASQKEHEFELVVGDFRAKINLERRIEELEMPPDVMFRHIKRPALALAGEKDLNVPPNHAEKIASIVRDSGNDNAISKIISGCDHNFQRVPGDPEKAFRDRYTFESFANPYGLRVYQEIVTWLETYFPSECVRFAPTSTGISKRAIEETEIDPRTVYSPERIQLAPGIEIIEDIADKDKVSGVETLEGRIGMLLLGECCQAHFIDMPAGMYLSEHPHSTESIIYTVRGKWVLCSHGRRYIMKPGSLFRFGANISTGYEVPFNEDAYILIFKGQRSTRNDKEFIDYLKGLALRLKLEQKEDVPYSLKALPENHPARQFASQVNADLC